MKKVLIVISILLICFVIGLCCGLSKQQPQSATIEWYSSDFSDTEFTGCWYTNGTMYLEVTVNPSESGAWKSGNFGTYYKNQSAFNYDKKGAFEFWSSVNAWSAEDKITLQISIPCVKESGSYTCELIKDDNSSLTLTFNISWRGR